MTDLGLTDAVALQPVQVFLAAAAGGSGINAGNDIIVVHVFCRVDEDVVVAAFCRIVAVRIIHVYKVLTVLLEFLVLFAYPYTWFFLMRAYAIDALKTETCG